MLKQILTYCILLNFLLILSPRTIWHSHDDTSQSSEHHHDHKNKPSHQHDDCYLCTFSIQPALTPTFLKIVLPQLDNFIPIPTQTPVRLKEVQLYFSLRAPPSDTNLC